MLQRRDESQIDFEELSVYLQRTLAEREKHPEKSAELEPKIREVGWEMDDNRETSVNDDSYSLKLKWQKPVISPMNSQSK